MATGSAEWNLTELVPRALASIGIVSLHALLLYLVGTASQVTFGGLDASVTEAEVLPIDRRLPVPPAFLPVTLESARPIEIPDLQIPIDVPDGQTLTPADITPQEQEERAPTATTNKPIELDLGAGVVRPQPIAGPRGVDRYPNASIKKKESGTVVMKICVSTAGKVESVELARSSGFPRLDRVAMGIASEYQFQPAKLRGHPVAACSQFFIVFKVT